jgi:membrane protein DedA with SNARE-associated domain
MAETVVALLRGFLIHHGYWAVAATLLLENMGLPVPGETILLLASFLAYSEHLLRLPILILTGILAATLGDNIGFVIGYRGGRTLLQKYQQLLRISRRTISRGERVFERYGTVTIFFARFVFGLRMIAGPLAGVLRMHWKKFAVFNFLGATLWVCTICVVGYFFGQHWNALISLLRRADALIAFLTAVVVFVLWQRHRRNRADVD